MRRLAAGFVAALAIAACGSDGMTDPGTPEVASISLGQTTLSFASLGEVITITAAPRDASGGAVAATVSWSSSDAGVATVAGGAVTAVGNGTATITAMAGSASATASVTVQQVPAGASVTPGDGVIKAASSLTGGAVDARGNVIDGMAVTWTSLTPGIVTVDDQGNLDAREYRCRAHRGRGRRVFG